MTYNPGRDITAPLSREEEAQARRLLESDERRARENWTYDDYRREIRRTFWDKGTEAGERWNRICDEANEKFGTDEF